MQEAAERDPDRQPLAEPVLAHTVIDRFQEVARQHAGSIAACDPTRSYTYHELQEQSRRIARAIAAAAEGIPGPVAILLPHDARYASAMLGVLTAGRAYVPLDADHPIDRNARIATHARVAAVLASGDPSRLADSLSLRPAQIVDLDRLDEAPAAEPPTRPKPDDVAYIIYTSGSTGMPKGVFQNHRGLLHDIMISTSALRLNGEDRSVMLSAPNLLYGGRVCFGALLNGASVHMLSPQALSAAGLAREIGARGITVWRSVPALFARIVESLGDDERLESLRMVYLGGDRVSWSDYDLFRRSCPPDAVFGTHLGSTECATLHWIVDAARRNDGALLPLGRPLPDRTVRLVDEHGGSVATGEVGEFMVGSRFLALGYWNDPELSARAFSVDPDDAEIRWFRSGDLGRRRADGLYEFVGRKDHQVKINGFRIEPGEIEGTLKNFSGVRDAAIVVRKTDAGIPKALVAYVELNPGNEGLRPRHLMAMSKQTLPRFMVPGSIFVEPELPRMPSMKVDRVRLSALDKERVAEAADRVVGSTIDEIARIFEAEIGTSGATADDNVASLGGDSLQTVRIIAELDRHFGLSIPEEEFESARSIRDLARWIEHERARVRV